MMTISPSRPILRRNLTLFLSYQFLAHLEFFNGLFVVFLSQQDVHISVIHLCLFATTAARTLGEFPSGYLGDRWGDRPMLLWGMSLMAAFAACLLYARASEVLVACFVLHGLSIAATSGADDGMLYRTVLQGNSGLLEKVRPWVSGANYLSLGTAALAGGALAQFVGWDAVFWGFCVAAAASVAALLAIRSHSVIAHEQAVEATSYRELLHRLRGHQKLFIFIASLALFEACANLAFVYTQVRCNDEGMSLLMIGISMACVELVSALGAVGSRWVKFGSTSYALCSCVAIAGLFIAGSPIEGITIIGCLLFLFIAALLKVLAETLLITRIDTELTATALSLFSLLIAAFTGLMHLLMATVGNLLASSGTMLLLAIITFFSAIWSAWSGRLILQTKPKVEACS